MNCWKTISVENEFGKNRLWLLSALTMLMYFIVFFVIFSTFFNSAPLVDHGIIFLITLLIIVFPIHVLLHCMPIWLVGKKARMKFRKGQWPFIYYSTKGPLSKQIAVLSTISPALIITSGAILVTVTMPHLMHYTAMMSALNIGICVYDFLNIKQLKAAPKNSFIEEHQDGYHILYQNQSAKSK